MRKTICTIVLRIGDFTKHFSPIGQNLFSRINSCSPFRLTYAHAGTELYISIKHLSFNNTFPSRHNWKRI